MDRFPFKGVDGRQALCGVEFVHEGTLVTCIVTDIGYPEHQDAPGIDAWATLIEQIEAHYNLASLDVRWIEHQLERGGRPETWDEVTMGVGGIKWTPLDEGVVAQLMVDT